LSDETDAAAEITALINAWSAGDAVAERQLLGRIYPRLRGIAARQLASHRGFSIQATEIVHEAYLKLFGAQGGSWESRTQFFAFAARLMRQILVDHARRKYSQKRDAAVVEPLGTELALPGGVDVDPDVLAIDEALDRLAGFDPRAARIVELRFFGGLTVEETAQAMNIGRTAVVESWRHARAWLRAELGRD
jgi:RNA polymerase sigma factor (TIGR02999 family)